MARVLAGCMLALGAGLASANDKIYEFQIPQQALSRALLLFSEQTGVNVISSGAPTDRAVSAELFGGYSVVEAVERLLAGSGLSFEFTDHNTLMVFKSDQSKISEPGAVDRPIEKLTDSLVIEEITVTATRRETSLQDTAMSISALGSEDIDKRGLVSMEDYLGAVPGVSLIDRGVGRNAVIIRGISADPTFGDPTAGVYFGDVPVTGLSFFGGNTDIKLVDMERVEVLRGPQGTLYGAASLAGTVRNIPNQPDMEEVQGKVKAGLSLMAKEGGAGNNAVGTINLPLVEGTLALRASAYRFENSGYLKNIAGSDSVNMAIADNFGAPELAVNQDDIGASEYIGGRVALRWEPAENLDLTLTYLTQDLEQDGIPEAELQHGVYEQTRLQLGPHVPGGTERLIDDVELINLVVNYDLGWGTITSSTSRVEENSARYTDLSGFTSFPFSQKPLRSIEVFVEELRLTSQFDGPVQFVAGFYYEDIDNVFDLTNYFSGDPLFSPFGPNVELFNALTESNTEQKAFFGELSYQFNEEWSLTLGARFFDYDKIENDKRSGLLSGAPAGASIEQSLDTSNNGNTGKINLSYSPGDDLLLYVQWSDGFRLGKPQNNVSPVICDTDSNGVVDGTSLPIDLDSTDPDTLESFELGGKYTSAGGRFNVNGAIYQNNWEGIPVNVFGDNELCRLLANVGEARTQGVEVEVSYLLSENLSLDAGASYSDAELTEDVASLNAFSGDRLPGSPRVNANIALQYDFSALGSDTFIRADYVWIGGFYADLQQATPEAGNYGLLNLKAGTYINNMLVEFYVKNLTGEDAISYWNPSFSAASRLRPRVVGFDVSYAF